jgi:anti-sigma factor RsiW
MMTCLEFRSRLDPYIDHELSAEDTRRADEHARDCDACRRELASHRELTALLAGHRHPHQPDETYWDESHELILARTEEGARVDSDLSDPIPSRGWYTPLTRSILSVAASVALLVTALLLGSQHDRPVTVFQHQGEQFIVSAELTDMMITSDGGPLSRGDQRRLGSAAILVGSPGVLGRIDFLPGLLRVY